MRHSRQQSHHFGEVWSNLSFVISSQGCSYFFWQRCLSLWSRAAEWLKSRCEPIKVPILGFVWQSVTRCLGILREVILKSNLQFITMNSLRRVICRSSVEILPFPFPAQWLENDHWVLVGGHIHACFSQVSFLPHTSWCLCSVRTTWPGFPPLWQARMLEAGVPKSLKCFRLSVKRITPTLSSLSWPKM